MTQKQGETAPSTTTPSPVVGIDCAVLDIDNTFGAGYARRVFLNIELEDGRSKRFDLVNFPNQPDRTPELLEQAASWIREKE